MSCDWNHPKSQDARNPPNHQWQIPPSLSSTLHTPANPTISLSPLACSPILLNLAPPLVHSFPLILPPSAGKILVDAVGYIVPGPLFSKRRAHASIAGSP